MNNHSSNNRIADLKSQKEALRLELESAAQAFISATQAFAEQQFRKSVEHAVTTQQRAYQAIKGGRDPTD